MKEWKIEKGRNQNAMLRRSWKENSCALILILVVVRESSTEMRVNLTKLLEHSE